MVRYNDGHIPRSMEDVGLINSIPSSIGAAASLVAAFTSARSGDGIIHATLGNLLQPLGTARPSQAGRTTMTFQVSCGTRH